MTHAGGGAGVIHEASHALYSSTPASHPPAKGVVTTGDSCRTSPGSTNGRCTAPKRVHTGSPATTVPRGGTRSALP